MHHLSINNNKDHPYLLTFNPDHVISYLIMKRKPINMCQIQTGLY